MTDKTLDAVKWYGERASSIASVLGSMSVADGMSMNANRIEAILTELSLDAGRRAAVVVTEDENTASLLRLSDMWLTTICERLDVDPSDTVMRVIRRDLGETEGGDEIVRLSLGDFLTQLREATGKAGEPDQPGIDIPAKSG